MAVDPETGNLLVVDSVAKTLSRWKPNGEPAPFTALGTNVIDAKEGADATPENGFEFGTPAEVQVVVDNSGTATDGDIYVTQSGKHLVDIFAADGSFLGQLTASFGPNDEQQKFNNPGASVTYNVTIPGYGTTANIVGSVSGGTLCKTYINPVLVSAVGPGTHCLGTGGAPAGPKTIAFIGALANTNIPTMEVKEVPGGTSFPVETLVNGGTGPTPLGQPCGVAVDASGAAYVADFESEAIHKYVSQGAPHNPLISSDNVISFDMTKVFGFERPCTLAAGAGATGGALFLNRFTGALAKLDGATGAFKYEVEGGNHKTVAVNPADGHVFALNNDDSFETVINEYDASGSSPTPPLASIFPGLASGIASSGASNRLYVASGANVVVFGPPVPIPEVETLPASDVGATGATLNGTVNPDGALLTECRFEYGTTTSYGQSAPCAESLAAIGSGTGPVPVHAELEGLGTETEYHFRITAKNANSEAIPNPSNRQIKGEDETFKTLGKPEIEGAWSENVLLSEATLKASINPVGRPTTYRFEWGLGSEPNENSTDEIAIGSGSDAKLVSLVLSGLAPGTTYHWRVVATNEAEPAGVSSEGALTTYRPLIPGVCPNQAFRTGVGAALPDCRAYEMVSPVDKAGSDIVSKTNGTGLSVARNQSDLSGGRLTFTSERRFGDAVSQPIFPQYIASRSAAGWETHGISPPRGVVRAHGIGAAEGFENEYRAFSEDLCNAWLVNDDTTVGPLTPDGLNGAFASLHMRSNCGAEAYRWLGASELAIAVQGITADGSGAIFRAPANLSQAAATEVGSELKCATPLHGEGAQAEAIAYRWMANGAPIAGANQAKYTATGAEEGKAIQCQITATSFNGGSTQLVNPAWMIEPYPAPAPSAAPRVIPAPTASAPLTVGGSGDQELSCEPSATEWSGAPGFSYQWYRNGAALESAEDITNGSQSPIYTVQVADLATAAAFQCVVAGTNAGGTVARASENLTTSPAPSEPAAPKVEVLGEGAQMLYIASGEGAPAPICVMPGGRTLAGSCAAGSATGISSGYEESVRHALAEGGKKVYWSGAGSRIFLRENPAEEQSVLDGGGNCTEASKACTTPVSAGPALFWNAAADGSAALFSEGDDLYRFDAESGTASAIAGEAIGVLGASEDLERIYLVSEEVLSEEEENSEEDKAQAGEPNLYLYEAGGAPLFTFVTTLAGADARPKADIANPSPISVIPTGQAARVSPDGGTAAFSSVGSLTGYDNTDVASGEADTEVYRYDAAAAELSCVSCNPSGARPAGRNITDSGKNYWAAGRLPVAQHALYFPRALSENGRRVFFESFDALVLADTNGAADVYQWEAAGEGDCTKSSGSYSSQAEGCISLISSGKNPDDSVFFDASFDGSDVFFSTAASLVSQDPALIDVYDARVEGGIAPPAPPAPPCEGEACQSAPAPPVPLPLTSKVFDGPGNVVTAKKPRKQRCGKGKRRVVRRGKARCVKKHRKRAQRRRAHDKRGAAR